MSHFPQLQTLSAYSLFKSSLRLESYIKKAKELGYETLALTDDNQLSGGLRFLELTKKYEIKGILGVTLEVSFEEMTFDILLYVKNQQGYENLLKLVSKKRLEDTVLLTEVFEGIDGLTLVFPHDNPLKAAFDQQKKEEFQHFYQELLPFIKKESVFIGISGVESPDEMDLLQEKTWLKMLKKYQIPSILLHPVHYLEEDDAFSNMVLHAIGSQDVLHLPEVPKTGPFYLWEQSQFQRFEMAEEWQKTIENTLSFGGDWDFEPRLHQRLLPHYPVPVGLNSKEYLRKLVEEKAPSRIPVDKEVYQRRLSYELDVIEKMGFSDYFLIVWDVLDYCHQQQIMTGAGRGSAAGSLVAYVLEITDVDPIVYDLLFERFLNPQRQTMPDIDMDIPDIKREEVLAYVHRKYGKDNVAQIATFGTLAAKQVIRDVARVFGYSVSETNSMIKTIPNTPKITLMESLEKSANFRRITEESDKNKLLLKTALALEGLPRHLSTHAAGVVISSEPLVHYLPLQKGSNDIALTQFTMGDVEKIGLLKMDFLGLKNLTILQEATQIVKNQLNPDFSLKTIPLDDEKTFEIFQKGETNGVFQFESDGIRSVLKRLKPTNFEDIVAVNALYRPGPLDNINEFIERKHGKKAITYLDKSLEDILQNTYGFMVYQEQVMQVANKLAGFSLGQADILRRAMSKKKVEVLKEQQENFVKGAMKNGHTQEVALEVYSYIEKFAGYGFNRSHAVAYSVVAYQLAYLKAHYPIAFYTALINASYNNDSKLKMYFGEMKKRQIRLFPPTLASSYIAFKGTKQGIYYGLGKIKGLRRDFLKEIIQLRRERPFSSFDDFLFRISNKWLKEDVLAPLILVGLFDEFEKNRRKLLQELPGKIQNIEYSAGSMSLLEVMALKSEDVEDFTLEEKLKYEETYLGIFVSGHPLETLPAYFSKFKSDYISEYQDKQKFATFIYVKEIKKIRTKKGEQMAFITGQDLSGETSFTIFPKLYRSHFATFEHERILYVKGKVGYSTYQKQLEGIVEDVLSVAELEKLYGNDVHKRLYLRGNHHPDVVREIKEILKRYKGDIPVILYFDDLKKAQQLPREFQVDGSFENLQELKKLLGKDNVVLKDEME